MPEKVKDTSPLGQYRQAFTSPEHRRAITVGRRHLVEDTLDQLKASTRKQSKHHYLFIGPRGIGKSHLLSLVEDGIAADPDLKKSYVVARFPEESHRTLSFADFLLGLCDILKEELPGESEWHDLYETYHTEDENSKIVDAIVPALRKANRKHDRTTLVVLENLNELFTRQIKNKQDIAAFRKFFMDANGCMLLATSPLHFNAITSVDEPFYDFFDVQLIEHLSEEETAELVRRNLDWEKTKQSRKLLEHFDTELRPKIYALYRMTAGNPRLTVMLYELIAHDSITEVRQQLEVLLDRITPFYQDRLNDLPPQERAVLETMARMRDMAKTPAAITERMRLSQNKTSMLLKRLSDAHYIHSIENPNDRRSRIYAIRERFFDIWLVMNVSRAAQKRIPYLLNFFAIVYPSLEERSRKREELLEKNDLDSVESLAYLSEIGSVEEKRRAKYGLAEKLGARGKKEEAHAYLRESYALDGEPKYANYLDDVEEMIECWDHQRGGDLEAFADKLTKMSQGLTYKSWSETKILFLREQLQELKDVDQRILIRLRLASLLSDLTRWNSAEELLRAALAEAKDDSPGKSTALNNLAQLLQKTNRLQEAEPLMRRALQIHQAAFGEKDPTIALLLSNLAQLLQEANRLQEAEPLMRQALQIHQAAFGEEDPSVARDLNNLASLLQRTDRLEEAEPLMRRALEIDRTAFGEEHPTIAIRLGNLAHLLQETYRLGEAEPLKRRALQIDRAAFGEEHPSVAISLNNLALLLQETNRLQEAEPLMRRALRIDRAAFGEEHPSVARDLNNLASLLKETNRLQEAEPLMRRALWTMKKSYQSTNYTHPHYRNCYTNYDLLLKKMELPEAEIAAKLAEFPKPEQ